jgi:hypothetical protein
MTELDWCVKRPKHTGITESCPQCEIERLRAALEKIVAYSGCEDNDQYYEAVDAIAREAVRGWASENEPG